MKGKYDPLYVQFLYYFNEQRDYFECHEVMEALWLEEGRMPLFQGLLQVAVGLYHERNGNRSGAVKLLSASLEKLDGFEPQTLGIQLSSLVEDVRLYLYKLLHADIEPFSFYDLTISVVDPVLLEQIAWYKVHPPESLHDHH